MIKLNSLHTIITKETPDISKEEFDKFAKELKLKEESILAQKEKIQTQIDELKKQNLENTQQYNTSLQELEQQNAGLNSTIQSIKDENTNLQEQLTNSSSSSQTNALLLQELQKENKEYKTKNVNSVTTVYHDFKRDAARIFDINPQEDPIILVSKKHVSILENINNWFNTTLVDNAKRKKVDCW